MSRSVPFLCAFLILAGAAPRASAQPATGYELALDGSAQVRAGRVARFRGVAYRTHGLATLRPWQGAVRARFADRDEPVGPWVDARSGSDGRFEVAVPIPAEIGRGPTRLQVEVGPRDEGRTFELSLQVIPAVVLSLRTDRNLYEPGEPVHVWAWLRDAASLRPLADQAIHLSLSGDAMPAERREVRTDASGVATLTLAVPPRAPEAMEHVEARLGSTALASRDFRVGTRTYERILATVEITPDPAMPGATATAVVRATSPSGQPVLGAQVLLEVEDFASYGETGPDGVARIDVRAPSYTTHDTGRIAVHARVEHPAHGSVVVAGTMRLAVPLALSFEAVPRHGALIPEIDDVLYVRAHDGLGGPPAEPTTITVEGPAVGGRASATTDANGMVAIPIRLPLGSASSRSGSPETSVVITASGALERIARVTIPVAPRAEVAPTPERPVVEPGASLGVRIDRRPDARRRDVVLELLDDRGELLATRWAPASQSRVAIELPGDRVGVFTLRARAVHEDESLEGTGGVAAIVVRPPRPDFVTVEPEREQWKTGDTARIRLRTQPNGPRSFGAVLVRDVTAQGGEAPFEDHFLARRFDQALLVPTEPTGERLVFAALGARLEGDAEPYTAPPLTDALGLPAESGEGVERGLRDPWPFARELERRGAGAWMTTLEGRLRDALASGSLDAVAIGGRRFRDDALVDDDARTLGDRPLTPTILEAADPAFRYDAVARRVARERLVRLMVALAAFLDPGDDASPAARMAARERYDRWLPRMVERGLLEAHDLDDPWGGHFVLRPTRQPALVLGLTATGVELVSPGPDRRPGTRDDVRDPFARAIPAGTPYAVASGEDALMRQLSILSPVERTLAALAEAYRRTSAEMREEEIGDAVAGEVSEGTIGLGGLGTIGRGAGGGGSGYGAGAGGFASRNASVPRVRGGMVQVQGLAAVLRERFPPTLLFVPSIAIDPSGTTVVPIPLADAVTSYIVEAIVWREDGWVWSARTTLRVVREVVMSAPVPEVAHRGDRIRLPLRVANYGDAARSFELRVGGSEALGLPPLPATSLRVDAGGSGVVEIELVPSRVGEGTIDLAVVDPESQTALDAIRMPMRVLSSARRVEVWKNALAAGPIDLAIEIPAGAEAREGAIQLEVGATLFAADPNDGPWIPWTEASPSEGRVLWGGNEVEAIALSIGAAWKDPSVDDAHVDRAVDLLVRALDRIARDDDANGAASRLGAWSTALLLLAPVAAHPDHRALPRVREALDRLRREVAADSAAATDPYLWACAAAALSWTAASDADEARPRELLRRLERHVVAVGEDRWLALPHDAMSGTIRWAMAAVALGRPTVAFQALGTVYRDVGRGHALTPRDRAFARAAIQRMMGSRRPTTLRLVIDGEARSVPLENGASWIEARGLAEPGPHTIRVEPAAGVPVAVQVTSRFGVPWESPPEEAGPLVVSLEGETGGLDDVAELELVVRNRAPRTLGRPVIEIELPTGAELTSTDEARVGVPVARGGGVLTLRLPPMRPGNERRIPLPLRWSVPGVLIGLGVSARADEREAAVTIVPPRPIAIDAQGGR